MSEALSAGLGHRCPTCTPGSTGGRCTQLWPDARPATSEDLEVDGHDGDIEATGLVLPAIGRHVGEAWPASAPTPSSSGSWTTATAAAMSAGRWSSTCDGRWLARAAGHRALAGHVLTSMSHQAIDLGRERDALAMLEAAHADATAAEAQTLVAKVAVMQARFHARLRHAHDCEEALALASGASERADPAPTRTGSPTDPPMSGAGP
jgi:hypothetical protein